ncbi:MAG: hypothetical protein NVSMB58_04930 [Terriglobales bacterium]
MRFSRLFVVAFVLSIASVAFAAGAPAIQLLPKQFAGWQAVGPIKASSDPADADPVNAELLKEYGFTDFQSAKYSRDDGRKVTIKAARFADASGAYGAFTYYKLPQMLKETIGDQGASLNERVLFYRGNVLVDAVFEHLSAMSAAELRELAGVLPSPAENAKNLPGLPVYLPHQGYIKNTAKYVVGPAGLQKVNAPISAQLVDFNLGAEVVLGNYSSSGGEATLVLISYPTPQIAAEHLRQIDASIQLNSQPQPGATASPLVARRTGPIVVVAAGPLSQSEAKSLVASVNYEADVTWNENTSFTRKDNIANLLVNIIILSGIICGLAVVAGIAFGGFRILIKRYWPDRVFDRSNEVGFISLHLSASNADREEPGVSTSIEGG